MQVFLTSTYGANNQYLQKRLTGAGSTISSTEQYGGFGGKVSGVQNLKLYTSPPLTERPNDEKVYSSGNHDHNHNHGHQKNHDHSHNNPQNSHPETSSQQIEKPRKINYPRAVTTNTNIDKNKDTTERYNRDIAPVSSSKNRVVPDKINATSSRNTKGKVAYNVAL